MIAMMDKDASLATEHRKGYCKLITEGVKLASLFTPSQKKMLEVFQIWTICRSELNTDDSFLFGKNMSRLRVLRFCSLLLLLDYLFAQEMALQLPACTEADDAAILRWKQKMARDDDRHS